MIATTTIQVSAANAAGKIVISDADGKVIHVFDQIAENILWARDSRAIVYSRESAIYLQDLAGGPPRKIADFSPDEVSDLDWTADGKSFFCVRTSYQRAAVVLEDFR
jgi:Tol biopolymer transport system component